MTLINLINVVLPSIKFVWKKIILQEEHLDAVPSYGKPKNVGYSHFKEGHLDLNKAAGTLMFVFY